MKRIVTAGFAIGAFATCAFAQTLQPRAEQAASTPLTVAKETGLVAHFHLPSTQGPHPVVIAIGGSEGGLQWADRWGEPLSTRGYAVLALAYFGMEALPAQLEEIPLEYFKRALDWVSAHPAVDPSRIALAGFSKGAEAALLVGATYPNVHAVVAGVPSHVVWQGINPNERGRPDRVPRSSWTLAGTPVPFVAYDTSQPVTSSLEGYTRSLRSGAGKTDAVIPVERIRGPVLLVSGEDDRVWPSSQMADLIMERLTRQRFAFSFEHHRYPNAGHPIVGPPLPGGLTGEHSRARMDAWERTVTFLDRSLVKR